MNHSTDSGITSQLCRAFTIDGNIAVGKSTLCKQLQRTGTISIVDENVGDAFTQLFYSDPRKYGFAMQLALQGQRTAALSLAVGQSKPTVLDRSVIGDWAFALWNRAIGNLSEPEWQVYVERAGASPMEAIQRSVGLVPIGILFLHDDSVLCKFRAQSRGGPDADIDPTYLHGIEVAHAIVMLSLITQTVQVTELSWFNYSSDKNVNAIRSAIERGSLHDIPNVKQPNPNELYVRISILMQTIQDESIRLFLSRWMEKICL